VNIIKKESANVSIYAFSFVLPISFETFLNLFPAIRTVAFYGGNFAHSDRFSTEIFFAINRCVCLFVFACSFASYLETHHSMHFA